MDLSHIPTLSRPELQGWHAVVSHPSEPWGRPPLQGEIAALHARAKALGATLSTATSRAALFGSTTAIQSGPPDMSASTQS